MSKRSTTRSAVSLLRGIWILGAAAMLMDTSTEMMQSVLPLFMSRVLGAGMVGIGLIEGVAEAAASFMKLASGALSDRQARRKPLVLLGYGLSALSKPFFPVSGTLAQLFAARIADRIGKGIRGAPRDALVAGLVPPGMRGAAFGLRQALDSAGAVAGPLVAFLVMHAARDDIAAVLWVAVAPAALCVAMLAAGVREPAAPAPPTGPPARSVQGAPLSRLPSTYWLVVLVGSLFTLARFSDAFLLLSAAESGLPSSDVPMVMVAMNSVYAAVSYPAGRLADRFGARRQLAAGMALLLAADITMSATHGVAGVFAGAALWGAHLGFTQGVLARMVTESIPDSMTGTAFGFFHFLSGLAALLSGVLAGLIWQGFGRDAAYAGSAIAALLAGVALAAASARRRGRAS